MNSFHGLGYGYLLGGLLFSLPQESEFQESQSTVVFHILMVTQAGQAI